MSDKTPKKKRRRQTSSVNSAESKTKETKESNETKEVRVKSKARSKKGNMPSNQGNAGVPVSSTSDISCSTTVPGTVITSAPYFVLPSSTSVRFPRVPHMPPITSVFPVSINPMTQTVNSQSQPHPHTDTDLSSQFSAQLNFIMDKVSKLDGIECQQAAILSRLNHIEAVVSQNKRMIQSNTKQIADIEKSQSFLSSQYDKVCKTTDTNKENVSKNQTELSKLQGELKKVTKENKDLKKKNDTMADDIIDLKCRSMRDNLVFIGIPETVSAQPTLGLMGAAGGSAVFDSGTAMDSSQGQGQGQGPSQNSSWQPRSYSQVATREDCNETVWEFCKSVINIHNPSGRVFIDRAHRSGTFNQTG